MTRYDASIEKDWKAVGWWAGFELPENRDLIIAHAKATPPRRLNDSVIAFARALRPLGPPTTEPR